MANKNVVRRQIRQIRDARGSDSAASAEIGARLLSLEAARDAKSWFVYVSAGSEVDTHELIRKLLARGDCVTVPRVIGPQEMVAQKIESFDNLVLGEFGILAPVAGAVYQGAVDICVCPGIAFSEEGNRLGSGRGFYDRYLAVHAPRIVIGLALECQLIADLPLEPHDRPMDWIITERRVIQAKRASR